MRIVFRTEGNHAQGMGDVMGCLALAEAAVSLGHTVHFIVGADAAEAVEAVRAKPFDVSIAPTLTDELRVLRTLVPSAVVLNKLNNDPAHVRALRGTGAVVMTIDDVGPGAAEADIRVNVLYHVADAHTEPELITLRDVFRHLNRHHRETRPAVDTLLVAQGGADTYGFLPKIVRALRELRARPRVRVIVGPAFKHDEELGEALAGHPLTIDVLRDPPHLPRQMWEADLAITAAGLMLFELACVGTPSIVVSAERFEVETAERLAGLGAALSLGFGGDIDYATVAQAVDALSGDFPRREAMSAAGRRLVDGAGAPRVIRLLAERAAERRPVGQ